MGDNSSSRFPALDQINRSNVKKLKVAWTYRSGDSSWFSMKSLLVSIVAALLLATTAFVDPIHTAVERQPCRCPNGTG